MTDNFREKRAEARNIIDQYYSVEFSVSGAAFVYHFKIWNLSSKGMCVLVKEDSGVLNHLKTGDVLDMKYYRKDSSEQTEYLKTKIRHITMDDTGRFKGHYLVGLSILEEQNSHQ